MAEMPGRARQLAEKRAREFLNGALTEELKTHTKTGTTSNSKHQTKTSVSSMSIAIDPKMTERPECPKIRLPRPINPRLGARQWSNA